MVIEKPSSKPRSGSLLLDSFGSEELERKRKSSTKVEKRAPNALVIEVDEEKDFNKSKKKRVEV